MDIFENVYYKGRQLEKEKSIDDRKGSGVFYTPIEIVDYMSRNILHTIDLIENPYTKILDLSCGAGYFLFKSYELLRNMFQQQLEAILERNTELQGILTRETINRFIVENNIWGVDTDAKAVGFVQEALQKTAGSSCRTNIICADSLLSGVENDEFPWFWTQSFDVVIGNPPYLGHKAVPGEHKAELYKHYKDVYRDKADISYCFFKRGMDLLKQGGKLSFITSRYFMEGPSASGLRAFLRSYAIEEILDFGDSKVFNDAGVAVCVIGMRKSEVQTLVKVKKVHTAQDTKLEDLLETGLTLFDVDPSLLKSEGWVLQRPEKLEVFRIIEENSSHRLDEIFESRQGIITGCDKAFILDREQAERLGIESSLLRPWIKNSQIEKGCIKPSDKLIIYTDFIGEPDDYPAAIAFAEEYRNRLMQRRECQKGLRHWYQLQWGRDSKSFESPKIIYPYKASENRFAVDRAGLYCSADVYSLTLKEEFRDKFSLEYLAALLNSKLVEFYFKCFAKRISSSLFDYYPNTVLRIMLKLDTINPKIIELANSYECYRKTEERECILRAIDREVYMMYDLKEEQIQIIENSAGE